MFSPDIETIKTVKWNGEDHVDFAFKEGTCWSGAKRKDFWNPDENWEKIIKPGCKIRLWTVQFSIVLGFEVLDGDAWRGVWCHANDFSTKAEREKSAKGYDDFIKSEGKLMANLIDQGKSLKEMDKLISNDHSGNTHACALMIGIRTAKNRVNADNVRREHNKEWGGKESMTPGSDGLINPAVMTLVTK